MRAGHTLLEMLVAVVVGALVIGLGATIGFRHQRFHRDVVIAVERTEQLSQVVATMPIAIRSIAPGEGDIAPGAARDTSLEFRATVVSGVVCDTVGGMVSLAPAAESPRLVSILARPEIGDTAWVLVTTDSTERWLPRPITGVFDVSRECRLGGAPIFGPGNRPSIALRMSSLPPPGGPLRVTRPWRYSLYKASDGAWYVGAKDWNSAAGRFNTIQPVAGPFASAASGGLRFRYADSTGATLPSGTTNPSAIALVEIAFRVDSAIPGKYGQALSVHSRATAAVAIRNRK